MREIEGLLFDLGRVLAALILKGARLELDALRNPAQYGLMLVALGAICVCAQWGTARLTSASRLQPTFDDEPIGRGVTHQLWDSRFS